MVCTGDYVSSWAMASTWYECVAAERVCEPGLMCGMQCADCLQDTRRRCELITRHGAAWQVSL
jgi:hypothetical protein